jgi:hypothetical protein
MHVGILQEFLQYLVSVLEMILGSIVYVILSNENSL